MNHIFDRQPDLPQQPMPSEIEQAIFGKTNVGELAPAPVQNPWIKPSDTSAAEHIDFAAEETEMFRALLPIQKLFDPNAAAVASPEAPRFRFSKTTTPATDPAPTKPTLRYETERAESGLLIRKGFDAAGEIQSYLIVFDETEA